MRLPSHLADTIGEIADVFETERNGKRAFLLVTKQSVLNNDMVLQPDEKVVKPDGETDNDCRFKALESEISELKSLLLTNERESYTEITKTDGLGRIRIGDLRRVKAMS
jgi:hypothetical protein